MGAHGTTHRDTISGLIARFDATVTTLDPALLSSVEVLAVVSDVEALGRRIDALRVRIAAEVSARTGGAVDPIAAAGYASARDAIARLAGVSEAEASRRIRVGLGVASGRSLAGQETAPRHPAVANAVTSGGLGVEAAGVLMRELDAVSSRLHPEVLAEVENQLVDVAAGADNCFPLSVDTVRAEIAPVLLAADPDGATVRDHRARQKRNLAFGRETVDGLLPVSGMLIAEVGVTFRRLVESHTRKVAFVDPAEATPTGPDDRTPAQRRHDTLADILSAASRVKDAPELAGTAPAVTVTITQTALDTRGAGYIDGHDTPVPARAIEKMIDARGLQQVTFNERGRILALGSVQRCFTASQRRAINARDGGCVIPGCTTPAGWCEVHHVIPWRNGGATHTDNGVLLCWGHHQNIDTSPWKLSMPDGIPHVRGPGHPGWTPVTKSRSRPPKPSTA